MEEETKPTQTATPTPKPKPEHPHEKKNLAIPLLILAFLSAVAWGVYGFVDAGKKSDEVAELSTKVGQLETEAAQEPAIEPVDTTNSTTTTVTKDAVQPVEPAKVEPIVVYEPGGLFSDAVKTELLKRLVDPYLDYMADEETDVVTLHISAPDTSPGEWTVFAIHQNGAYSGFLYGNDGNATQDWWYPECIDGPCEFSPEYSSKYPDVVTAAGS